MRLRVLLFIALLGLALTANAQDSKSSLNLSWMVSVSGTWDGTNADLNGQLTDYLPRDVPGTGTFKQGRFPAGTYHGTWRQGDFVFYRVAEVVENRGEWRDIIRHGRCGNPATGRYWHAYCIPEVVEKIVEKVVEKPVEVIKVVEKPVEVIKVVEKIIEKMVCQPQVTVNVTNTTICPPARREAPQIASLGATRTTTQTRGATIGGGAVSTPTEGQKLCPPYPTKPIPKPPVPPAPPMH